MDRTTRVTRYTATWDSNNGLGKVPTYAVADKLWGRAIRPRQQQTNLQQTYTGNQTWKLIIQRPAVEYVIQDTMFSFTRAGKIHYVIPQGEAYDVEQKPEEIMYYCREIKPPQLA